MVGLSRQFLLISHCYDSFGFRHVYVGCYSGAYPSNFAFIIFSSGIQTSPLYGSDVQTSSASHLLAQQQVRCSNFICITFAISAGQTFRLRLLHIRRSDFASIWIRCSDFICITFASTAGQTFRLRFLHIRRSDFASISIRCSDFICITFAISVG